MEQKKLYLILGILFICIGTYRIYQQFYSNKINSVKLVLGILFLGYGVFRIYFYFKKRKQNI